MKKVEIIIKDTHRGLWYEDGVLTKVVEAGRYEISNREGLLGRNANARIYIGFDKPAAAAGPEPEG